MNGEIVDQKSEWIGVRVTDNNGVMHKVAVEKDSGIRGHSQDGYPDKAAKRTPEENEHVEQARRYAKYYVFRERGHTTVEPRTVPEWVAVAAMTIARLSSEEFEEHFGDYHQQFRSTVDSDVEPVVDIPDSKVAGLRSFRQNIHLRLTLDDAFDDDQADALRDALDSETDAETLIDDLAEQLDSTAIDLAAITLAGTSSVGALYQGQTEDHVIEADDPHPGPADARLELAPMNVPWDDYLSTDGFQFLLVYHLLCQVRDCYLRLGLEVPEGVRILGMGTYRQTVRNEHLDLYDPVHYTDADIDGYRLPDFGHEIEL